MAITYVTKGTTAGAAGSVAIVYPAGIAANDIIVVGIVTKYPPNNPDTPSGWTLPTGARGTAGQGANTLDSGTVIASGYYRVAAGTESAGTVTFTVASGNSNAGNMVVYRPTSAAYDWSTPTAVSGSDVSAGTAWIAAMGGTLDTIQGDLVISLSGINSDANTFTNEKVALPGITTWSSDTERNDVGSTSGDDSKIVIAEHFPSAGTSTSTAGTFTMTANGSTAGTRPAGVTVLMRLREYWARGTVSPGDGFQAQTGDLATGTFTEPAGGWAGTVTPFDGFQAQLGDAAAVYATYSTSPSDGFQAQTGDAATVFTTYFASPVDGNQTQTGDAAGVSFSAASLNVTPADGFQTQTGDIAGVSAGYPVAGADGFQAQTGDTATVRATYSVTPADGQQDQYQPDPPTVRAGYPLTPGQGFQAQTGDTATLSGVSGSYSVTPSDGFQAQTGDGANVRTTYAITPVDGFQAQTGDSAVTFAGYFVIGDQGYQTQTMDAVSMTELTAVSAQTPRVPIITASNERPIMANAGNRVSVYPHVITVKHRDDIEVE